MQTRVFFILIFLFIMLFPMRVNSQIVTGAEQMDQYLPLLKGKRVGMVVNHTSIVGAKPKCPFGEIILRVSFPMVILLLKCVVDITCYYKIYQG